MALPYEVDRPGINSDWASMRDSFYILTTMNQYQIEPSISSKKEAEGLLRIVLFSKDLRLLKGKSLLQKRSKLAQQLRASRKRGVVPVYISTMWFIFSLALSIQTAFGDIGHNTTAHDLALGMLLSWLPVLILCSIIDRNPVTADDVRRRLNKLIDSVRFALQDEQIRREYISTFQDQPEAERMKEWVNNVSLEARFMRNFFVGFAGQGRVRWFYGAAHPIICNIENCYVAERGRNWLHNEVEARTHLVLGPVDEDGLLRFDFRELWQIISAVTIVGSTISGAFILSYCTPTVGLGCRSGSHMIFGIMSFSLLLFEMLVWWISSHPSALLPPHWVRRSSVYLQRHPRVVRFGEGLARRLRHTCDSCIEKVEDFVVKCLVSCMSMLPLVDKDRRLREAAYTLRGYLDSFHDLTVQQKSELLFFRPLETVNAIWLLYIVMAQTVGYFRSCLCITSTWGFGLGGYLDFAQFDITNSPWMRWSWATGTVLAVSVMGISMIYVVAEWCLQSHLSTENYSSACRGLQRVRRFRRLTHPICNALHPVIATIAALGTRIEGLLGLSYRHQKSLRWTKEITFPYSTLPRPSPQHRPAGSATYLPPLTGVSTPNPQFELQDYNGLLPQHTDAFSRSHYRSHRDSDTLSQRPLIIPPLTSHSPSRSHAGLDMDHARGSSDWGSNSSPSFYWSAASGGGVSMERSTSEGGEYLSPRAERRQPYPRQGSDAADTGSSLAELMLNNEARRG